MKVVSIGGGPAGLYASILMKRRNPDREITVFERNRRADTFGFGVVFSDATLGVLEEADAPSYAKIIESFAHWDDIDVHFKGEIVRSTGHGFAGCSRQQLLDILADRAIELGVDVRFETDITDFDAVKKDADLVLGADGVNSAIRDKWADVFQPRIDWRPNRFVWLGTTFPFDAFTFYFEENEHGMFRVHAYRFEEGRSTFIVECTEDTWKKAGLDQVTEQETVDYMSKLFAKQLDGHPLLVNRSIWRSFPTITCDNWAADNVVLMGDAVHTAHFSIGSGTKLAMDDAIALADAIDEHDDVKEALATYEASRRPDVESLQRAAQVSLEWFENTERYMDLEPLQFTFSLLTRSLRVTHENLRVRDPELVKKVDDWFAKSAGVESRPPMFTPYKLRDLELSNRVVVSPMCMYSADDGTIDDWHLVHLGSRAMGGAALVMTEMTDVSADGRITPGCAGMYQPQHVPAWKRVTDFVHRHTGAKIGLQLAHAGRKGSTKLLWEGYDQPLDDGNWPLIAPSAIPYSEGSQVPKAMDRGDMDRVKADFVRSAEMAVEAGFDIVELHLAHGYLLGTFLSPLTNQREDEYGGSVDNRLRFPLEVLAAVREVWPDERPISARISATDWAPGGTSDEDLIAIAKALNAGGADIIDVSTGQTVPHQKPRYGRLYQTPFAERIRLETGIPVMTVGGISSFTDVNSVLAAGRADLCVLARAHLYDPYWTRHAADEQDYDLRWPNQYVTMQRYNFRFK